VKIALVMYGFIKNMCLLDVGMVMISIKLCEYTSLALLYCNGGHARPSIDPMLLFPSITYMDVLWHKYLMCYCINIKCVMAY